MNYLSSKATLLAMYVASTPVAAIAADLANGEQVQELLSGNTLMGAGSEGTFAEYYDPDGTIRADGYTAKWKVENNTGCMDYTGDGEFTCWTVQIVDGPAHVWFKDGQPDAAAMMVTGNPKNF